jgi:hypothetical protein
MSHIDGLEADFRCLSKRGQLRPIFFAGAGEATAGMGSAAGGSGSATGGSGSAMRRAGSDMGWLLFFGPARRFAFPDLAGESCGPEFILAPGIHEWRAAAPPL